MLLDLHRLTLVFVFAIGLCCVHVFRVAVWLAQETTVTIRSTHGKQHSFQPNSGMLELWPHSTSLAPPSSQSRHHLSSTVVLRQPPNTGSSGSMTNTMGATQRSLQQQNPNNAEVGETIRAVSSPPVTADEKPKPGTGTGALVQRNKKQKKGGIPVPGSCDCSDAICPYCHRGLIQVHKMGVTLLNTVMWKYFPRRSEKLRQGRPSIMSRYDTCEVVRHAQLGAPLQKFIKVAQQHQKHIDYRHVVVTRDWEAALLSGYLYHKAGMECDLDWFGNPDFDGWLKQEDWEQRLLRTVAKTQQHSWPPGRGRHLCGYLAQESERDGMRVYMAWAKAIYLDPLLQFVHNRRAVESPQRPKTLYLCFEDFVSNYTGAVQQLGQWFVSNSEPLQVQPPKNGPTERDARDATGHKHATSQDPVLRQRLQALIRELDETVFAGAIAAGNAQLGCSSATSLSAASSAK